METPSNTALLIVILVVIAILLVLFFTRLHQLRRASERDETESENAPSRPWSIESTSSSLHTQAEILNASVIVITRERASILPESPRRQSTADESRTDSESLPSPPSTHVTRRPTIRSVRSEIEMIERSPEPSEGDRAVSPTYHASPLSPRYPDSMYTSATLPSYPGTVHGRPPAYSDLSRTQSRTTSSEVSQRMMYGDEMLDAMPDLTRLEEGRQRS